MPRKNSIIRLGCPGFIDYWKKFAMLSQHSADTITRASPDRFKFKYQKSALESGSGARVVCTALSKHSNANASSHRDSRQLTRHPYGSTLKSKERSLHNSSGIDTLIQRQEFAIKLINF